MVCRPFFPRFLDISRPFTSRRVNTAPAPGRAINTIHVNVPSTTRNLRAGFWLASPFTRDAVCFAHVAGIGGMCCYLAS